MEIATVEGHGRLRQERYAVAGDGGLLVAGRQTSQQTFAAPVGDGHFAMGRIEESVTVAMHEDERGNQRAFYQVARKFHVTGIGSMVGLGSSDTEDEDEEETGTVQRCCFATLFLLATAVYLAMMIFGAINFHACPDTRLAIYMVVQGVIASLNAGSAALVIICNCYTRIFHKTFMTIYVFNLVWSGIGGWWMVVCCPGTFLVNIAVGFTVPIWTPLAIFCCCCCCLICGSCSDD